MKRQSSQPGLKAPAIETAVGHELLYMYKLLTTQWQGLNPVLASVLGLSLRKKLLLKFSNSVVNGSLSNQQGKIRSATDPRAVNQLSNRTECRTAGKADAAFVWPDSILGPVG